MPPGNIFDNSEQAHLSSIQVEAYTADRRMHGNGCTFCPRLEESILKMIATAGTLNALMPDVKHGGGQIFFT
jgi:hypothetical protein